jgi:hypothetical protein
MVEEVGAFGWGEGVEKVAGVSPEGVLLGEKSFGKCHWQPVSSTYNRPLITSRRFTERLRPPRLPGGISGRINAHSASVRSLGYHNPSRRYRRRLSTVHKEHLHSSSTPLNVWPAPSARVFRVWRWSVCFNVSGLGFYPAKMEIRAAWSS